MTIFSRALKPLTAVAFFGILLSSASCAADSTPKPVFEIQRVYLKELELKEPNSPAIFLETEQPKISVTASVESSPISADIYEVVVGIVVTGRIKNKVAFTVSAKEAGIFHIKDVPAIQMHTLHGVGCPNIIYPYLRANIADAITRAGFPPVHLAEINWETYYEQEKKRKK
ncbi:protein-export chaperone SecB [Massilia sp. P8910]|uniref:protein-export chaperone SecB n=1 Tax=Massilia antarctica TaxID=2765360 RepID=UPI001E33D684|nr:protein-export chaperone SecB [Massilia antarctica]MCE3608466.1 protein-export chaperone SecB [Massilia antarctica]